MEQQVVAAEVRTDRGKNAARRLRRSGKVPAILYGAGKEAVALSLNPREVTGLLRARGQTRIFQIQTSQEKTAVMLADPQFDPLRGTLLHLDLHRIAMDRKLHIAVPIVITGEAPGVKQQGGILELVERELEVECLPADIPPQLTVEVQALTVGQSIRVSDLQSGLGDRIRILRDPHAVVCHVVVPKVEEVKPAEVAEAAPAEPEVIKKGKAAPEEEGEGEAAKS